MVIYDPQGEAARQEIYEKLRKDKDFCKKPTDISQILENRDALKSFFKCSNLGKISLLEVI
jgi:hypothetical protein